MNEVHDSFIETEESDQSLFSAILLIAGTCIGAGMLALPVVGSFSGFYPSLLTGAFTWLFMTATGLLLLEAVLWMPDGDNMLSLSKQFLGRGGEIVTGLFYLFLYYCLLVSYISGGAPLTAYVFAQYTGIELPLSWHIGGFTLLFGSLVLLGTMWVSRVNWLLMTGLIISFILLVMIGSVHVQAEHLNDLNWNLSLIAIPTFMSAYGYHNIVPTISTYLKRDARKLRMAIIAGTAIPFVIYSLWQWIALGTLSSEQLQEAAARGISVSQLLQESIANPWISGLGIAFGFFALVTSLLGVGLSMVDFLGDGFHTRRSGLSRLILCLLVFVPPAIFAGIYPNIFIEAIGVAGGIGETVLNGFLPIGMVWVGRYQLGLRSDHPLPGGKMMLAFLTFVTIFVVVLEIMHLTGP